MLKTLLVLSLEILRIISVTALPLNIAEKGSKSDVLKSLLKRHAMKKGSITFAQLHLIAILKAHTKKCMDKEGSCLSPLCWY